jgi:hypothetical protein
MVTLPVETTCEIPRASLGTGQKTRSQLQCHSVGNAEVRFDLHQSKGIPAISAAAPVGTIKSRVNILAVAPILLR